MEITDGGVPDEGKILEFIKILENEIELRKGAVAIHCRAGLGRTGTMISAYMMHKYDIMAGEAIAWTRLCRPGCVMGPQHAFLEQLKPKLVNLMLGKSLKDDMKRMSKKPELDE